MNQHKIIDKIRKLLRLSKDKAASENEAATAARQAKKMMDQHEIENAELLIAELRETGGSIGETVMGCGKSIPKYWNVLIVGVSKLFECEVLISSVRVPGEHAFLLRGTEVDRITAITIYDYLLDEIDRMLAIWWDKEGIFYEAKGKGAVKSGKLNFRYGCAVGLCMKMGKMSKEDMSDMSREDRNTKALMTQTKAMAIARKFGGNANYRRGKVGGTDRGAMSAGRSASKNININRQLGGAVKGYLT